MLVRAAVLRRGRAALPCWRWWSLPLLPRHAQSLRGYEAKLRETSFAKYGANVVVIAKDGRTCGPILCRPSSDLFWVVVESQFPSRMPSLVPQMVIRCRRWNGFSSRCRSWTALVVSHRLAEVSHDVLVGTRAAGLVGAPGKAVRPQLSGSHDRLNPVGSLKTGAAEDSRVYMSLIDFTDWTQVPYSTIGDIGLRVHRRKSAKSSATRDRRFPQPTSTPSGRSGRAKPMCWARCDPPSS